MFEIAHCWAHVRRKFVAAEEFAPAAAREALDLTDELYAAAASLTGRGLGAARRPGAAG
jgi:hypothetical protein